MSIEVGRLLAPYDIRGLDEGDVIEALATYTLDLGVYGQFHRYTLCAVGVARGFFGRRRSRDADMHSEAGYTAGENARVVYDAWRSEP